MCLPQSLLVFKVFPFSPYLNVFLWADVWMTAGRHLFSGGRGAILSSQFSPGFETTRKVEVLSCRCKPALVSHRTTFSIQIPPEWRNQTILIPCSLSMQPLSQHVSRIYQSDSLNINKPVAIVISLLEGLGMTCFQTAPAGGVSHQLCTSFIKSIASVNYKSYKF